MLGSEKQQEVRKSGALFTACQDGGLGMSLACAQLLGRPELAGLAAASQAGPQAAAGVPGSPLDVSEPPVGNTGGKLTVGPLAGLETGLVVGLDGWACTFPKAHLSRIRYEVSKVLGEDRGECPGLRWYGRTYRWEAGAVLGFDDGRPEAWLSINGDSAAAFSGEAKLSMLAFLVDHGAKGTRLDPCVDDYSKKLIDLGRVHAAAESAQVVGFRRYDPRRPRKMGAAELEGDTAYFGSRGSDGSGKYVRFYDKELESKGRERCNRFEVEFSGARAEALFEALASSFSVGRFLQKLSQSLGGAIDFADKERAYSHRDRMERLAWWDVLVKLLGSAVMSSRSYIPPLQRTVEYWRDNWTGVLAEVAVVLGEQGYDGIAVLADLIRRRMKDVGQRRRAGDLDLASLLGDKCSQREKADSECDFLGRRHADCEVGF